MAETKVFSTFKAIALGIEKCGYTYAFTFFYGKLEMRLRIGEL